jgi:hypothetical protein
MTLKRLVAAHVFSPGTLGAVEYGHLCAAIGLRPVSAGYIVMTGHDHAGARVTEVTPLTPAGVTLWVPGWMPLSRKVKRP